MRSAAEGTDRIDGALQRVFGHCELRPGQAEILEAVMGGRDCIGVLPTGGGKSLCYQLPAVMRDGLTLVISPLIALMKDQVDALSARGVAAACINSALGWPEMRQRLDRLRAGGYRLVYVAPERFRDERFQRALARCRVGLVAVDEAHCISAWGHDFRPDYLQIQPMLVRLGHPQVLALTATATPQVRADLLDQLGLGQAPRRPPALVVAGFARPNLTLAVRRVADHATKLRRLRAILADHPTGIVYCATRGMVEKVARRLQRAGVACAAYHGGLDDGARSATQERFGCGRLDVVVATNAFGMGIDRADLRCVVHWDVPGSLEAYYQEAGRAGRDGAPARCELLFNYADVHTQEYFLRGDSAAADRAKLRTLLRYVDFRGCRHRFVLRYFGETSAGEPELCDACDNCLRRSGADDRPRRSPTAREREQIVALLQGAAELGGRFGRARLAQTLAGSRDRGLLQARLDRARCYGALAGAGLKRLRALIDELEAEGCLESRGEEYPTLFLTAAGAAVLRGEAEPRLALEVPAPPVPPPSAPAPTPAPTDDRLVEALRALRTELASQRGVPAYRIFNNRTLAALAAAAPRDETALLAVHGIGPAKARDLGPAILRTVAMLRPGARDGSNGGPQP
jgi:ATP-dependent DNA helicase RecQ